MIKVTAAKVSNYSSDNVQKGIEEIINNLGSIHKYISPNEKILIKPNMLEGVAPEKAVTTHPEIVRAVIKEVKKAGAIPVVGDSPGISNTKYVAEKCKIADVCRDEQVELVGFSEVVELTNKDGRMIKKFHIAKNFLEADKVICLAKMKTHTFMGITGGIKNLFGFVVGTGKAQFHLKMQKRYDFAHMLVDLNTLIKPTLYIIDGIIGMEGNGPRNGKSKQANVILASTNGYAIDLIMAEMMGFEGEKLPVQQAAIECGLGVKREDIEVVGTGKDIRENFIPPYNLESLDGRIPKWLSFYGQKYLTARPLIEKQSCRGCNRCAEHCPPEAIKMKNGKAKIDYAKCIRCYCCQELCPYDAVALKDGKILKITKMFTKMR